MPESNKRKGDSLTSSKSSQNVSDSKKIKQVSGSKNGAGGSAVTNRISGSDVTVNGVDCFGGASSGGSFAAISAIAK